VLEHQNSDFFVWYIAAMINHMTLWLQNHLSLCSAHKANKRKILFSFVQLDKNYDERSQSWLKLLHSVRCLRLKKNPTFWRLAPSLFVWTAEG